MHFSENVDQKIALFRRELPPQNEYIGANDVLRKILGCITKKGYLKAVKRAIN